jgi:hypothetical protein
VITFPPSALVVSCYRRNAITKAAINGCAAWLSMLPNDDSAKGHGRLRRECHWLGGGATARIGNSNIADPLAHFRARSTSLGACFCESDEDKVCKLTECHWKIGEIHSYKVRIKANTKSVAGHGGRSLHK